MNSFVLLHQESLKTQERVTSSRGLLYDLCLPNVCYEVTLHQAFDAYIEHIRRTALTPAS